MTTSADAIHCPLCTRKLPISGLEGVVWIKCRNCKRVHYIDSKKM